MVRTVGVMLALALCLQASVERVGVDPRVELFSILFRLAGNTEYNRGALPGYNAWVDSTFKPLADHEAVRLARQLRETRGVGFDAVMSLAIHVTDVETLAERVPFDAPGILLDRRWRPDEARRFLEAVRRFVADSNYLAETAQQQPWWDRIGLIHRESVVDKVDLQWFRRFFGTESPVRFVVASGLLNGGNSYGPSIRTPDDVLEVWAIQGVSSSDSTGIPVFNEGHAGNLVHEFTHSYANPLVDQFLPLLEDAGRQLFEATRAAMEAQNYANARSLLYETLVRACSARYAREVQGAEAGENAIQYEHFRSFVWTRELFELLGEYGADRESYPSLDVFMPRVAAVLGDVAPRVRELLAVYEASRPRIEWLSIDAAVPVDPGSGELVIRFDRKMRRSAALYQTAPALFPRFRSARWDESQTSLTVVWELEAGRDYEFRVNHDQNYGGFLSDEGVPLRATTIRFRTAN